MRIRFADQLIAPAGMRQNRQLIAHCTTDDKQPHLFADTFRHHPLQPINDYILSIHIVANNFHLYFFITTHGTLTFTQ